jgi:hypothetical protein
LGLSEIAQPGKRKKRTTKKGSAPDPDTVKLVAGLYGTIFGLTATRAGGHWAISQDEAHQLAEPTIAVLNKYGLLEKLTEHSEILALGLAASAILAPRIIVTVGQVKEKRATRKVNVNAVPKRNTSEPRTNERKESTPDRSVGQPANPSSGDVSTDPDFYTGSAII